MSRVLAQLMGAAEPQLRAQLMQLERAAGLPGADIKLMMEVVNGTRAKIRELGLDPHDTTGPELYQALKARLQADEARLREVIGLQAQASPTEILTVVAQSLDALSLHTGVFVAKQSVMRAVLKKLQPKKTMQCLGYRSVDSMLKHEPIAQVVAAVSLVESHEWNRRRLNAYKKLTARDFEMRAATFLVPAEKHWPELAARHVADARHNLIAVPELGTIVLLPMEHDLLGLAITTSLLLMNSLNDMRTLGSYVKLQQVRPDFGDIFARAIQEEPGAGVDVFGEQLSWKAVHWFYGSGKAPYHPDVFEPHVQPEDLGWHEAEKVLARLQPVLEFWVGSQWLALLDGPKPVSLNMLDVALSVCNGLDYGQRLAHNMRAALGRELLARYLHHDNLHALLTGQLSAQLAPELA